MRVLLFTGKGGTGTTTVAAATAVQAARSGTKTLLLSGGSAPSIEATLGVGVSGEPAEVEPALFAMRPGAGVGSSALHVSVRALVDATRADPVVAEEPVAIPGAADVLALLELRDQVRTGPWDLLVLDGGPLAHALRLLALPEQLQWCLTHALPVESRIDRALGAAVAADGQGRRHDPLVDAADRLASELAEVQAVLRDPALSVRLVLTPETVALAETRRAATAVALYGYPVDGVVANRVLSTGEDAWRSSWAYAHEQRMAEVRDTFAPLPVAVVPYLDAEPLGPDALATVGRLLHASDDGDLLTPPDAPPAMSVDRCGHELVLELTLPLVERRDVDLSRQGDELLIAVAGHRRRVVLPAALRRCVVTGASLRCGRLRVRFEPDPALWRSL